jgi:hypothetical protein
VKYQNRLPEMAAKLRQAMTEGVVAAAAEPANAIRLRLRGGYTSGAFVTGLSSASVTQSEPTVTSDGAHVRVGTNVKYAPYWEFGHHNAFTRKYERVEVWRPGFLDSVPAAERAFLEVFQRVMGDTATAPGLRVRPPGKAAPRTYSASVAALGLTAPRGH